MTERSQEEQRGRWMEAAQQGDAEAYAALLGSLLPVLRGFVQRRGVAHSEVEDVVQEVLISIHRARHTFQPGRRFDPWMWAIARNASIDALRRQTRERARRADAAGGGANADALDALPDEAAVDAELQLLTRELDPRLARALAGLPAAQREAVELLYVEQLSVKQAAARAGVRVSALTVRAHRGSRALRAALQSEGEP